MHGWDLFPDGAAHTLRRYGLFVKTPRQISRPPRRKLTQKDPIRAEIKNAAPAQSRGLYSIRLQNIKAPPPAQVYAAEGGGYAD